MSISDYPSGVQFKVDDILKDVRNELMLAISKHEKFPSCHHGESVIREEYEELWDEIKANRGNLGPAKREALQLACVAVRYVLDLCQYDTEETKRIQPGTVPSFEAAPSYQTNLCYLCHTRQKTGNDGLCDTCRPF